MWTHTHSASGWPRRRLCFHTTSIGAYQDAPQPQLWRLGCLQSSDQSLLSKWATDRAGGLCPDQGRSGMLYRVAWFMISKSSWGTMIFYQEGPLGSAGGTCPSSILRFGPEPGVHRRAGHYCIDALSAPLRTYVVYVPWCTLEYHRYARIYKTMKVPIPVNFMQIKFRVPE